MLSQDQYFYKHSVIKIWYKYYKQTKGFGCEEACSTQQDKR